MRVQDGTCRYLAVCRYLVHPALRDLKEAKLVRPSESWLRRFDLAFTATPGPTDGSHLPEHVVRNTARDSDELRERVDLNIADPRVGIDQDHVVAAVLREIV